MRVNQIIKYAFQVLEIKGCICHGVTQSGHRIYSVVICRLDPFLAGRVADIDPEIGLLNHSPKLFTRVIKASAWKFTYMATGGWNPLHDCVSAGVFFFLRPVD